MNAEQPKQTRPKSSCDCFECSVFCRCACHAENPVIPDPVDAFDWICDLVKMGKYITSAEVLALRLTGDGLNKLGQFFANHSYYPDAEGLYYNPKRGNAYAC